MNRTARILLISATFGSIFALAACSHPGTQSAAGAGSSVAPISTETNDQPAGAQPITNTSPAPTVTVTGPAGPAGPTGPAAPVHAVDPGKPASFWTLKVTYPTYCVKGSQVLPQLSWNAVDTTSVAISVDQAGTVGGYGFFNSIGSLTMPSIPCDGAKGDPLPIHEYEIDAFGTNNTRLHIDEKVAITVSPNLTYPGPIKVNLPVNVKQAI
jgi:hypothetical protein